MKNYAHQNSIEWITHTHKICWPECDKESRWCCHHHHHLLVGLLVSRMWCLAQTLSITFIAVLFAPVPFSPPPPIFLSFHPLPVCVYTAWMQFPTTICVCVLLIADRQTQPLPHTALGCPLFSFLFLKYISFTAAAQTQRARAICQMIYWWTHSLFSCCALQRVKMNRRNWNIIM